MIRIKLKALSVAATASLISLQAYAADLGDAINKLDTAAGRGYGEDVGIATPEEIVGEIISIALLVVGGVFLILMIYGGYIWMIARGDDQKVKKAKETIISAVIGIIIVLAAYAITSFILNRLTDVTLA